MEVETFTTEADEYWADHNGTDAGNEAIIIYSPYPHRHGTWAIVILITAYLAVLLLGVVGNSLVIAVMSKTPSMKTVTNSFITNLAVADLLVLIVCLPPTLISNIYVRK